MVTELLNRGMIHEDDGKWPQGWGISLLGARRLYILQYNMIQCFMWCYILHSIILWEYTIPAIAFRIISSIFSFAFPTPFSTNQNNKKPTNCRSSATIHPTICRKKKRPETAPEVLFALHDPRSSRGGADDQTQPVRAERENTVSKMFEACDVWYSEPSLNPTLPMTNAMSKVTQ